MPITPALPVVLATLPFCRLSGRTSQPGCLSSLDELRECHAKMPWVDPIPGPDVDDDRAAALQALLSICKQNGLCVFFKSTVTGHGTSPTYA